MSSYVALHTQLASIMEVLANAAVAEICKLIDDGYAVLRSEMSRSQKENEVLKRKLSMTIMELRISKEGRFPPAERDFHSQLDVCLWRDGEPTVVEEDTAVQSTKKDESADLIEIRPQSILIKKETPEEDLEKGDLLGGLKSRRETSNFLSVKSDGGERASIVDPQPAPATEPEELSEQHGTRRSVWEDSGLDAALKAEPEHETVNLQHTGPELSAGRLGSLSYEYVAYERSGHPRTFFTPEITPPDGPACSYASATDPESPPAHTELRIEKGAGDGQAPLGSLDVRHGAVVIDSVPSDLESDTVQGVIHAKHRLYKEHREREESPPENAPDAYSPQLRMTVKENVAVGKPNASETIGYGLFDESFTPPKGEKTYHKAGTREKRFICTFCGKSFTCPKNLETHQRVHTGEKPFSCAQCGKRFADSSNRKRHQIIHTGERPYSCTLCGKRFTQSSCLIAHQRVHTGEKPFSCTQCGKRFADSSNLKRHQSVHTGKKPLNCTLWEEFTCFKAS